MSLTSSYAFTPVSYPELHWLCFDNEMSGEVYVGSGYFAPPTTITYVIDPPGLIPNTSTSQWVSLSPTNAATFPAGEYSFETAFDLTGFDPMSAVLTGFIVVDANGLGDTHILINGSTPVVSVTAANTIFSFTFGPGYGFNASPNNALYLQINTTATGPIAFQVNLSLTATNVSTSTTVSVPIYGSGIFSLTDPAIVPPATLTNPYPGLITSEHANKPKYMAWVAALTQAFVDLQNTLLGMPLDFYLNSAVGQQLDWLGQWIGAPRALDVPIGTVTSMDDNTYRTVLKAKAAANSWDSTLPTAAAILNSVFAGSGTNLFLQDNQDMSQTIGITGVIPTTLLLQLIVQNYLSLKPAAVQQNVVVTSVTGAPIFGLDVENQYVSGCDVGAWGTIYTGA